MDDSEISNPNEFSAWASSLGIDLACPLVETVIEEAAPAPIAQSPDITAQTPGYPWEGSQGNRLVSQVSTDVVVVQVDDIAKLQNQLEHAQQQIREQQMALKAAQELAPAPPAAPRSRELPDHMRPFMPMTPVPSSALAALHSFATPIGIRSLAPVPEEPNEPIIKSKSKAIVTKSVSYTEAFANGIASTAQAHADMERKIVELQGQLVKRKWSRPLAYVLKLPLTVVQAIISAIRTMQS